MTARDVMTPNPVTVTPQASLAEVWDLMRELKIRHVPVARAGVLAGMVSDRDFSGLDVARVLTVEGAEALRKELARPVINVMSADVICVEPETGLGDVIDLLLEHKVGALPVVLPDTRELVGIVSSVDVLRALRDLVEEE
ncbi:MAG TPA: CBS domain-containing protein [Candidatus Binatia bacterium]|nr:CBS domain-containing protein [Candidatus Binatia bacterium]